MSFDFIVDGAFCALPLIMLCICAVEFSMNRNRLGVIAATFAMVGGAACSIFNGGDVVLPLQVHLLIVLPIVVALVFGLGAMSKQDDGLVISLMLLSGMVALGAPFIERLLAMVSLAMYMIPVALCQGSDPSLRFWPRLRTAMGKWMTEGHDFVLAPAYA